jgi:hypothetical protein
MSLNIFLRGDAMRRRKDPSEKLVTVGALVHPTTEAAIDKIALQNERARGWIANKLILRGLAAYLRDGLLDEPMMQELKKSA